jgi:hypothetical protein
MEGWLKSGQSVILQSQVNNTAIRIDFLNHTHLQHVQESGLASIVEPQEKELSVLVEKAQRRKHVVN